MRIEPGRPNRIRSLRLLKQPSMSQCELAQRFGCSGSEISKYERSLRTPTLAIAIRIAAALASSIEEVFVGLREQERELVALRVLADDDEPAPPTQSPVDI